MPPPRRPKGRWFLGLLLLTSAGWAGHHIWSSHFRYRAYGTVTCKTVEVSPPWDGVLAFVHHRQGDRVRQGDLLMTVRNLELRHRSAQIADELRVEQARLEELGIALARLEQPETRKVVAEEQVDRARLSKQGQEHRISMLRESLAELKRRADEANLLLTGGGELGSSLLEYSREQLKPNLARIAALQAERARLSERRALGDVRAPVSGIVLKHLCQVGESCKASQPIVSLLDESSLQVALYLGQDDSTAFAPGCEMQVEHEPYDQPLRCTLVRLGDAFEAAPAQLKRHYSEGEQLLPAYLQPASDDARLMALPVNGVVRLTRAAGSDLEVAKR